jgi:nucleotide-binding universal stress UspA family protein
MREITVLIGREGQDEPPALPESAWVVKPLAVMGECMIWFYADDAVVDNTDRMYAMMERMLHVAVATCVGESVHPFQTFRPNTVLVAIPRASLDDIQVVGELAERIRQANDWEKTDAKFGVVNIPSREAVPVLDEVINELSPSVVYFYAPDAVAKDPEDAMELTAYLQDLARKHETAFVLCLTTSEEHVDQIERASSSP